MALPRDEVVLLHNPRCSKSRALKAALDERGVAYVERRDLDEPLDRRELEDLVARLGVAPREVGSARRSCCSKRVR